MKHRHLFLLTASLALTTAAVAQTPGPGPGPGRGGPPMMRQGGGWGLLELDANADGKLTRAEFDAGQKARFNELDGNKDGSASPEEVQAAMQARFQTMEKERFAAMDTDKNGQLSLTELQAGRENGRGFGPPGGPGLRMRGGPDGPGGLADGPRRERAGPGDADNDGKVTLAEFTARPNEAFARADANKDGTVTIAELQALARGPR
jgi:Ca2+-binding EF-hand superfamily protein